jgi:AcrR family transcriptional regulator
MSPRPYQLGKRQGQIDESRRRVVDAARALLAEADRYTAFTVEAVAKRADVARATVYYQFGSKTGLLEALCDALAEAGRIADLSEVFANPDPLEALGGFVAAFGRFWAADRLVMRRLRALAALDREVEMVIVARDGLRRQGLRVLVDRLKTDPALGIEIDVDSAVRALHAVTSFETFDTLAGADRDLRDITPLVVDMARATLRATGQHRRERARLSASARPPRPPTRSVARKARAGSG